MEWSANSIASCDNHGSTRAAAFTNAAFTNAAFTNAACTNACFNNLSFADSNASHDSNAKAGAYSQAAAFIVCVSY